MRICFTTDLHGDRGLYEQLANLLRAEKPDLLILGGDLFADGTPADPLGTQGAYIDHDFIPRVLRWRAAAPRLTVACVQGNHDWACTRDVLQRHHDAGRVVLLDHLRLWHHDGFAFLGHSSTPPTPYTVKDFERLDLPGDPIPSFGGAVWDRVRQAGREVDLTEHFRTQHTLSQELEQAPAAPDPWMLVAHTPPYDSKLDRLPQVPYPIGSRAVRQFIEQRQPAVALHGHVHESAEVTGSYSDRLGRTLCINPGQNYTRLYAVLFDAERPAETLRHTVLR